MNLVDSFLNKITMYRLTLYILSSWVLVGLVYSIFRVLPFNFLLYIFSLIFILTTVYLSNLILSKIYKVPVNVESSFISGLILFLIISPPRKVEDLLFIFGTSILISLSKYLLAIHKKHIFNPVALSIFVAPFIFKGFPSWWVGNISMLPFIVVGGILIVKKLRRWDLVLGFLAIIFLTTKFSNLGNIIEDTTLFFFVAAMLVEPLTTPPTRIFRIIYGGIVGFLFYKQTPELALLAGNVFSYLVSFKYRLVPELKSKTKVASDIYDFVFGLEKPIKFTPGQYMEFTLSHPKPDSRGNRRYLSLAGSPTEGNIRIGVKFGNPPSSFKKALINLKPGEKIIAGQLVGDFTLPKDSKKKLVLIAGGIGITPFRSMLKYLIDTGEKRDIIVIYSAKTKDEFVYQDILEDAEKKLGIKVIYNASSVSGHMNSEILAHEIPDYKERSFYISGSHGLVNAFEGLLKKLQVPRRQIVTDYFPGFA